MFYCNTIVLYNVYTIQKKVTLYRYKYIMKSILNRHIFSYIYIHCILKISGKCDPISVYTTIGP